MRRAPSETLPAIIYPRPNGVTVRVSKASRLSGELSSATAALLIVLAALAAAAGLTVVAPDYFTRRGFPLDDAWIHAVYGRELARTGIWAYNPGIPATGSTSPLWSGVLALAHLFISERVLTIFSIKWIGVALHVLTALMVYAAFPMHRRYTWLRLLAAVLVALHPDLVSASVSGMEVPLAALIAAALVWAAGSRGTATYALLAAAAFLSRPELTVVAVVIPLVACSNDRRAARVVAAAVGGIALVAALLAARNLAVSGMPLPATFYAKVGQGADPFTALALGFRTLMPQLALAPLAIAAGVLALGANRWRSCAAVPAMAGPAFVAALVYCAVSFLLVTPHDPGSFYHQRYVLPALPLLLASAVIAVGAVLLDLSARSASRQESYFDVLRVARALAGVLLVYALVTAMPGRFRHLANDARNIDDVQVAIGRTLADAAPTDVVWAVDAGAIRYFGNAFVVDMMGLNTPELLDASAQSFLDAHPPRYVEVVPLWAYLDDDSTERLAQITFAPSTPYTVTSFAAMQTHHLVRCDPHVNGNITMRGRQYSFACPQ